MAQVEEPQTEGEGSPQMVSLRSDVSGSHADDGEVGPSMRRKRKKKKDPRPESFIVYRSEMERAPGEDQGGDEGAERSTEEGTKFLCTPTGEGWSLPPDSRYVTLTGTITRGKKKGQVVDIHVTLTEKEIRELAKSRERLDAACEASEGSKRTCSLGACQGPMWSCGASRAHLWFSSSRSSLPSTTAPSPGTMSSWCTMRSGRSGTR
uniref:Transmembrane protein 169 n=1 Tax=Maylandia zebra TaxID=106582 RepID=A0A3P9BJ87_9CICH